MLTDVEAMIYEAYQCNQEIANSDRLLILSIWQSEGLVNVLGDKLEAFRNWFIERATSTETICRAGRKLRSHGLIKASPEVAEARRQLAQAHRELWRR